MNVPNGAGNGPIPLEMMNVFLPTTEQERTAKELAQLRHAQKVMGAILANEVNDDSHFERRKNIVEMGKADKRAAKMAKKLARRKAA